MLKNTTVTFRSMYCLSYPSAYPKSGQIVKKHLNNWLTWFRRKSSSVPYFWFLEFQVRGAPHVHLYLATNKDGLEQSAMAMAWASVVAGEDQGEYDKVFRVHNHHQQLQDFRTRDGAIRYAAKYALKTKQKFVPGDFRDVGRFWGASRIVMQSVPDGDLVPVSDRDVEEYLHQTGHRCAAWEFPPKVVFDFFPNEI